MRRTFAVTSSSSSLQLDPQGRGKVTFTVTHTGTETQTVRARLVAQDAMPQDWLSLTGEAERRLDVDGTEQFSVDVAVPSNAAAGSYSFRFDAVSVENPDDDSVEGPTVAMQVAQRAPSAAKFPWWIVGVLGCASVLVLVLGMLAMSWWLGRAERFSPPTPAAVEEATEVFKADEEAIKIFEESNVQSTPAPVAPSPSVTERSRLDGFTRLAGSCRGAGWNSGGWPKNVGYRTQIGCMETCLNTPRCTSFDIARAQGDQFACFLFGHRAVVAEPDATAVCYTLSPG